MAYLASKVQSPVKVAYYKHFPKFFMKPYGKVESVVQDYNLRRYLGPENCEWYLRPKIAASEFAEAISGNTTVIKELLPRMDLDKCVRELVDLSEKVEPLFKDNEMVVTEVTVKDMMKKVGSADVELYNEMEQLGLAMYMAAINFKVTRWCLADPQEYAAKLDFTDGTEKKLKSDPSVRTLYEFWCKILVTILPVRGDVEEVRRNTIKELDDIDDLSTDEEESTPKKEKKFKKKKNNDKKKKNTLNY